ncbi:MAG: HI0074 family nucleotidyltransferase substrate-binding subunit [Nitrospinota bacterium]
MALNLESLIKSINALERSIDVALSNWSIMEKDLQETVRAGIIQQFEVAYEQCSKMIQRWLRENRNPEEAENPRSRKELFRMAARHALIADPVPWFYYGEARNRTAHTYNEGDAVAVYSIAGEFLKDAQYLMNQLKSAND